MMSKGTAGTRERKRFRTHGRERVVAQNFADVTFLSSVSRTRWSFLEANVPVVVSLMVPFVIPIDEMQMKPPLMMAALITGT